METPSCLNFGRGNCRYGDQCRFLHVMPSNAAPPTVSSQLARSSQTFSTRNPRDVGHSGWFMHTGASSHLASDTGSQQYPYPSHVNASNFVSVKLSGTTNYHRWQEQMMCLVESHDMLLFINDPFNSSMEANREWRRSDALMKGWIFGSLSEDVMDTVLGLHTANEVWNKLKSSYSATTTPHAKGSKQYKYLSQVNAASFLSIKLSGMKNYLRWHDQIICLMESHGIDYIKDLVHDAKEKEKKIIAPKKEKRREEKVENPYHIIDAEQKMSDALVKGWIFGSLSEDVMHTVVGRSTALEVWTKLHATYGAADDTIVDWRTYRPLYRAILDGDWEKAHEIFNNDSRAMLGAKMNDHGDSPLHIAVTCEKIEFVKKLLDKIDKASLQTLVNIDELTTLHRAAESGNTNAVKLLVQKNKCLLFILDKHEFLPIHRATFGSQCETYRYLLKVTKQNIGLSNEYSKGNPFKSRTSALLFTNLIRAGFWDDAYKLIMDYPDIATKRRGKYIPLKSIAGKPDLYHSGTQYNVYQRFVYSYVPTDDAVDNAGKCSDVENHDIDNGNSFAGCNRSRLKYVIRKIYLKFWKVARTYVPQIKHLYEDKVKHDKTLKILKCMCEELGKVRDVKVFREHYLEAIHSALENDIPLAVEEMIKCCPHFISVKHNEHRLHQLAILNRCEKVYNVLVYQVALPDKRYHKIWLDKDENNLLHIAGKLAPPNKLNLIPGAALQMQRELQWFEEVQKFVLHRHTETKNKNQETPIMVFKREHKELRKDGEEWMKKMAESYTIIAALIITIVFAAVITVPGGNDGNTGIPIFAKQYTFIIFAAFDAISLFSSTTSLLLFLSILTARYQDEDFLYRLPKRLILGLMMLFLSVTSMMVAFSATLYIMFGQEKAWILIPIAALTCLPIASFVKLQLPLLVDLISSTYGRGIFGKQHDNMIK